MHFGTNGNNTAMVIDTSQNVGIGTASPDTLLHLETGGNAVLRMTNSSTSATDETEIGTIEFEGSDSSTNRSGVMAKIVSRYSDTGTAGGSSIDGGGNEGGNIGFFTSIATSVGGSQTLAEKMRIENNGNIGIGTGNTNPKTHLDVQSYQADGITIGADNDANRTRTNSTDKTGGITGVHYTNAEESIRLIGYASTTSTNAVNVGGGNSDWNAATEINFWTAANATTTSGTKTLEIHLNKISGSASTTGSFGRIETATDVAADGDVIAFASSDERLKDNIKIIENPIEKVEQLRGVEFQWNGLQNSYASGSYDSGIIAQDVEKVLPQIVKEKRSGYLGVRQERLVGLLIEAIKDQQKQIDELECQIEEIRNGSS